MFDCHVHSSFSGDSEMRAEEACEIAIKSGLDGIAFTDHLDYDFPNFDIDFMIDFNAYNVFFDRLKKEYRDGFKVLKGIEVGLQPHVLGESRDVVLKYDFDLVIGSVHIIDGKDPYVGEYYEERSKYQAYMGYLNEIYKIVSSYDDFDILGHFDYIIRYCHYDDRSLLYNDHAELFDSIFKVLISKGKGIEINTASYRDKPSIPTPAFDLNIIKRYRELGGEIISLGSDAHFQEFIGYKFEYFREILLEAGFRYVSYFEQRKPVFIKI